MHLYPVTCPVRSSSSWLQADLERMRAAYVAAEIIQVGRASGVIVTSEDEAHARRTFWHSLGGGAESTSREGGGGGGGGRVPSPMAILPTPTPPTPSPPPPPPPVPLSTSTTTRKDPSKIPGAIRLPGLTNNGPPVRPSPAAPSPMVDPRATGGVRRDYPRGSVLPNEQNLAGIGVDATIPDEFRRLLTRTAYAWMVFRIDGGAIVIDATGGFATTWDDLCALLPETEVRDDTGDTSEDAMRVACDQRTPVRA